MKILYGKDKYFIGMVKFYDFIKDFGFIASNNCNMPTPVYEQDFYVNSFSFIEEKAKRDGKIVVFQIERQRNGKKRAVNVRCFAEFGEDQFLALSYYGEHERVNSTNLYNYIPISISLIALHVKNIIEIDSERSPEKTVEHFKFFIEHCHKDFRKIGDFLFNNFSSEKKSVLEDILNILTDEELLAILNIYPSFVRYVNNCSLIRKWLDNKLVDECVLDDLITIEAILKHIPQDLAEYARKRMESIVDVPIKALLDKLSKRTDINKEDLYRNKNINSFVYNSSSREKEDTINQLTSYLQLTSVSYIKEKEQCIASVKNNHFTKVLTNFLSQATHQHCKDDFFIYLDSLTDEERKMHEKEVKEGVFTLLDRYIDEKNVDNALFIIEHLQTLDYDRYLQYKQCLLPLIADDLLKNIGPNLNNYSWIEQTLLRRYEKLTAIYKKKEKTKIKQELVAKLKETTSLEVLSSISREPYHWLSDGKVMLRAKHIVSSWYYYMFKNFVDYNIDNYDRDTRFDGIILEKAIELVANIPLTQYFDGTSANDDSTEISPERANCCFLNALKKLIPNVPNCTTWNNYISSRNTEDLLILYDNNVIESLPDSIVESIINSITLESVYAKTERWYYKPVLQNKIQIKVLESTSVNLFPLIANRLTQLDLSEKDIPLAILLTELMTCNKPASYDYKALRSWEQQFQLQLENFKKATSTNPRISVILWAVHFKTATSMIVFADMFGYLPPYIQIKCVKKLFQLIAQGKIQHTAESLYNFIKGSNTICIPLEIAFAYLKRREIHPSATLDNNIMLQLIDGRDDHAEWIGIRQLVSECYGRCLPQKLANDRTNWKRNNYYNGLIYKTQEEKIRLYVPVKMIGENGEPKKYNNGFYQDVQQLIRLTYSEFDYQIVNEIQGVSYYFDKFYEPELFAIARSFNFKFNSFGNFLDFETKEDEDDIFCECRLSNKLDNQYGLGFYWCGNKPCFRFPVRYMLDSEWENYTLLDFMRILKIPTDYISKAGKMTRYGHYIILSSYLKSFAKFYDHLKCRSCGQLMKPADISNFTTRAVTEFACTNEKCINHGAIVYLNHCFNRNQCNATIDSRDSQKCSNGQYICPECGACCSTENFRRRINNLIMTGGYISGKLKFFVDNDLGHWEKKEIFCYKCRKRLILNSQGYFECKECGIEYKSRK